MNLTMPTFNAIPPTVQKVAAARPVWEALAGLLEYPGADFTARLTTAALLIPKVSEAAALAWRRFREAVERLSPDEREELYTATFDLSPACVPYVSIHLFGEENFQRGRFMAALMERYSQGGLDPRGELPDHLAVLLRFAAQAEPGEQRELAQYCLLGPLRRMAEALAEEHPYRVLLATVEAVIQATHPGLEAGPCPVSTATPHPPGGCSCSAAFLTVRRDSTGKLEEDL